MRARREYGHVLVEADNGVAAAHAKRLVVVLRGMGSHPTIQVSDRTHQEFSTRNLAACLAHR